MSKSELVRINNFFLNDPEYEWLVFQVSYLCIRMVGHYQKNIRYLWCLVTSSRSKKYRDQSLISSWRSDNEFKDFYLDPFNGSRDLFSLSLPPQHLKTHPHVLPLAFEDVLKKFIDREETDRLKNERFEIGCRDSDDEI